MSWLRTGSLCLIALLALAGCATPPAAGDGVTFVVVRHAEKATDDPEDPTLSGLGQQRAQRLARRLAGAPLVAIYATEFRRTRETAQPTADQHHLKIDAYFSRGPASESAATWRAAHARGSVLIVGHSNTVPDLVAALSGQAAEPMPETEYDRLTFVHIATDGRATVTIERN